MKDLFNNLKENGAVAAIGAVGLVAIAGMYAQRGGMNAHMPSHRGSAFYHAPKRRKKGSSKRRSGGRNAYSKFVGRRVKELHGQGYKATQAMKIAAKEWRSR